MPDLSLLTRDSVLRAIAECDGLGRSKFLETFGFSEARDYFLIHDGRSYDSKALAGVAYREVGGRPLKPADFSGGERLAAILRGLGLHVTGATDWTWPELILACALLDQHGWSHTLRAHETPVIEFSKFLRDLNPELSMSPTYRSANSVQRKLEDIRTLHPAYKGQPTRGGRPTAHVVEAFLAAPDRMRRIAEALRDQPDLASPDPDHPTLEQPDTSAVGPPDLVAAFEGRVVHRVVAQRERDPKLRAAKLRAVAAAGDPIACEVCGFDFAAVYGEHGDGYIQVHHVVPLHFSGRVQTYLNDLVLLCANCHVMIHRGTRWKTPAELRELVHT